MIATKQDPHVHNFTKLGYIREVGTSPGGEFVDRIILIRTCACGQEQAFECGPRQKMREKYATLIKGKKEIEG